MADISERPELYPLAAFSAQGAVEHRRRVDLLLANGFPVRARPERRWPDIQCPLCGLTVRWLSAHLRRWHDSDRRADIISHAWWMTRQKGGRRASRP